MCCILCNGIIEKLQYLGVFINIHSTEQRTILLYQRNALYFELCALLQLLKNEIVTLFGLINHGCHVTAMQKSAVWHMSDYVVKVYFMNKLGCIVLLFHMCYSWTKAVYFQWFLAFKTLNALMLKEMRSFIHILPTCIQLFCPIV